jgi:hypothetical protein
VLIPTKNDILKMTYKWNPEDAGNYAKALAVSLSDRFFQSKSRIAGSEILNFTGIKQLNLFIIKHLYARWKEENARLKSPFFDFESEEVKTALEAFMNILSRNISVEKSAFEGLLSKAAFDTLQLSMEPAAYFESELKALPEFRLTSGWLQENQKYYVVNKPVLEFLGQKLNDKSVYANEAISWLNEAPLIQAEEILNEFDSIMPLMLKKEEPGKSFFEDILKEQAAFVKSSPEQSVTFESRVNHIKEEVASVINPIREATSTQSESLRLNERLVNGSKTLNEKIITEAQSSLLDVHKKRKITSLKEGISLNQRFLFINNLFGGDQQAFMLALDDLEQYSSLIQARQHVDHQLAVKYRWEKSADEAEEFYAHLERKFS